MNDLHEIHSKLAALFPNHSVSFQIKVINFSVGGPEETNYTACISGQDCEWRCIANHCTVAQFWQAVARYHAAHPQECVVDYFKLAVDITKNHAEQIKHP